MASIKYHGFIVLLLIVEALCSNITGRYNTMESKKFQSKQNRLLTFNTQENGNINMELAFNVPFISIPVKKSLDMAHGAIANLNVGAVILAASIFFGFAIVIPGVLGLVAKKSWSYRSLESQQWWEYVGIVDQLLTENDIDTTSCLQRMICWTVKNSAENMALGRSSSADKIIDGLATNKWLQRTVEGTVVHAALQNGLSKSDCSEKYQQCKIGEKLTKKISDTIGRQ